MQGLFCLGFVWVFFPIFQYRTIIYSKNLILRQGKKKVFPT